MLPLGIPWSEQRSEIEGVGIFFGCGHHFAKLTKTPLIEIVRDAVEDPPLCPYCKNNRCLSCHDLFYGYSCNTCHRFESVEAYADNYALFGVNEFRFRQGIVLIDAPSEDMTKILGFADSVVGVNGAVEFKEVGRMVGESRDVVKKQYELQISEAHRLDCPIQVYEEPVYMKVKVIDDKTLFQLEQELDSMDREFPYEVDIRL
ncbi:hypothetical protein F4821DRAFT_265780 [Hypoxylon rubiginosum]|uniref:Uncharacterized protein n=1 Tax=Hypoxylon rubiginosum TaxID=110542 RepID=A0ACC0CJD2_9PEZI|nr:hypothetical protein F4821DRAFT_265780 [Hypoxylon rubiginosum]